MWLPNSQCSRRPSAAADCPFRRASPAGEQPPGLPRICVRQRAGIEQAPEEAYRIAHRVLA